MSINYKNKKLIVFDLDGTLTKSKSPMEPGMNSSLVGLLKAKQVAVIGGGQFSQFDQQFVSKLECPPELLERLYLFPTTASAFYRFSNNTWQKVYSHELNSEEKKKILTAFDESLAELKYIPPAKVYGEVIEDRGSQISFSPLGQKVVDVLGEEGIRLKAEWGATEWRPKIAAAVAKRLSEFNVKMGGLSTIDVTRQGIDKGYGLRQIEEHLHVPISEMLFIGDAIFPGGNDFAATTTGVEYIKTSGPLETEEIIQQIVAA